ncbi:hypothetical protein AK812_SmicGene12964 [Symbiodinium microadriaticum]|uniref:Uncharacterized protein n=1 Tax=Symbiodinium microadriaticum TaxID=2951 RepID=A0A1Q9E9A0_SYMMI|nr:hypothetical protein AK812_SmicGene12964 [Symbiodinium microadriaticum]
MTTSTGWAGGLEGWRVGGLQSVWRAGKLEGWRGWKAGWRAGGLEGWRAAVWRPGGLEGCRAGWRWWRVGGLRSGGLRSWRAGGFGGLAGWREGREGWRRLEQGRPELEGGRAGRLEEVRLEDWTAAGGLEGWRAGGLEGWGGWKAGGLADLGWLRRKAGELEGWEAPGLEGWTAGEAGGLEGWRGGGLGLEGWRMPIAVDRGKIGSVSIGSGLGSHQLAARLWLYTSIFLVGFTLPYSASLRVSLSTILPGLVHSAGVYRDALMEYAVLEAFRELHMEQTGHQLPPALSLAPYNDILAYARCKESSAQTPHRGQLWVQSRNGTAFEEHNGALVLEWLLPGFRMQLSLVKKQGCQVPTAFSSEEVSEIRVGSDFLQTLD